MCVAAAIGGAAVVGAGASLAAGSKASKAQRDAAETAAAAQERAAQLQIDEARRQFDTTRADYAPYRNVGYGALSNLAALSGVRPTDANGNPVGGAVAMPDFTATPGYQFRMSEGQKAIERSAAARGMLRSGGTLKGLTRYAQGVASDEYNTYANRLAALAGVGQNATGSTANAGQASTNAITNAYAQMGQGQANAAQASGNARASAYANVGNTINSGANNLASLYLYQQGGGFGGTTPGIY